MLVATGKTDWVRDVEDEKGSVMEAVKECGVKPENGVCGLRCVSGIGRKEVDVPLETHAFCIEYPDSRPSYHQVSFRS